MKNYLKSVIGFGLLFVIVSCSNDSENDLINPINDSQVVTYTNTVKLIIDSNCISCHANPPINFAPNSLVGYNDVKNNIANIIDRISLQDEQGGFMPPGSSRLPQSVIDNVVQWQTDGLVE